MDAARGVICRGPLGPSPHLADWYVQLRNVPSTVELLQEDAFVRFLATCKSKEVDRQFVRMIAWSYVIEDASGMCNKPTVFSTLTQTPIAVANNSNIWEDTRGTTSEQTLLEDGTTK